MALTLKRKFMASFAGTCLLTVASSTIVILQVGHMRAIQQQINTLRIPSALAAQSLSRYMSDAAFAFRNYALYGDDPTMAAKYDDACQTAWTYLWEQLAILHKLEPPEDQALLTKLDSDARVGALKIEQDTHDDLIGRGPRARQSALDTRAPAVVSPQRYRRIPRKLRGSLWIGWIAIMRPWQQPSRPPPRPRRLPGSSPPWAAS